MASPAEKSRRKPGGRGPSLRDRRAAKSIFEAPLADGDKLDLKINEIVPCPFNPRRGELKVDDLLGTVRARGVLSPVIVVSSEAFRQAWPSYSDDETIAKARWVLGPGHRRHLAAQIVQEEDPNRSTLPAIVRNDLAPFLDEILLIENLGREDLNPIEEARAFQHLRTARNLTVDAIAERVGCSKAKVSKRLALLKLPEALQEHVISGALGLDDARILGNLKDPTLQMDAWELARDEGLTVQAAVRRVSTTAHAGPGATADSETPPPVTPTRPATPVPAKQDSSSTGMFPPETPHPHPPSNVDTPPPPPPPAAVPPPRAEPAASTVASEQTEHPQISEVDVASNLRRNACLAILGSRRFAEAAEINRRLALAVLDPHERAEALGLAHRWLSDLGLATQATPAEYFTALSKESDPRVTSRAAFAIALAQDELRAAAPERPTWDDRDRSHVEFLVRSAGHQLTDWERKMLATVPAASATLVSAGNTDEQ